MVPPSYGDKYQVYSTTGECLINPLDSALTKDIYGVVDEHCFSQAILLKQLFKNFKNFEKK